MSDIDEGAEDREERRREVMERLAAMLQGPPPDPGGSGAAAGGGIEAAIAQLGLGLSDEDTAKVAGAIGQGPDPEEAAVLFSAMLGAFQAWQRKPGREADAPAGDDQPDA